MHSVILSPRDHHSVSSFEALERKHRAAIAKRARSGVRVAVHDVEAPAHAVINHGSWLVDCECGAGVAVDPDFPKALCFGCGAVRPVTFPRHRESIEAALLARPHMRNRNWQPGETVKHLRAENAAHGVGE